eukprot:gene5669-7274_t
MAGSDGEEGSDRADAGHNLAVWIAMILRAKMAKKRRLLTKMGAVAKEGETRSAKLAAAWWGCRSSKRGSWAAYKKRIWWEESEWLLKGGYSDPVACCA